MKYDKEHIHINRVSILSTFQMKLIQRQSPNNVHHKMNDKAAAKATTLQSITFLMLSRQVQTHTHTHIVCHFYGIPWTTHAKRYQHTKEKANIPIWPPLKSNIKWWIGEIVKFVWKFTITTTTGGTCHMKFLHHHLYNPTFSTKFLLDLCTYEWKRCQDLHVFLNISNSAIKIIIPHLSTEKCHLSSKPL